MSRLPLAAGAVTLGTAACGGAQSTLAPAGVEAAAIATLAGWLIGGGAVIWAGMMALAAWAARRKPPAGAALPGEPSRRAVPDAARRRETRAARWLILGGGVAFPVVTLTVLLVFGLRMMPALLAADGELAVEVVGEQWWWRVRYTGPGGEPIVSANEVRLPVGRRTTFQLAAADVIHSFWMPVLGGKIDMIPGRGTALTVEPTATGIYRGVCAEFCGLSHALMAFDIVVMEQQAFDAWLETQSADAPSPSSNTAALGQRVFLDSGCGACHSVRGTPASGVVGPDLTHVASRLSIAAGTLPPDPEALAAFIREPESYKPGVEMPAYGMLAAAEIDALVTYLRGLE